MTDYGRSEIFKAALKKIKEKRMAEEADARIRRQEVYQKQPRVRELDSELGSTGAAAMKYYLAHPDQDKDRIKKELENRNAKLRGERAALLRSLGLPEDYTDVHYECPDCHDTGFIDRMPDGSIPKDPRCHCLKKKILELSYHSPYMKKTIEKENFSTFNDQVFSDRPFEKYQLSPRDNAMRCFDLLFRFCQDFPDTDPRNVFISGKTGTGKTYLCNCVAKALLDRGFTVIFQPADDIINALGSLRFSPEPSQLGLSLKSADMVIIDDLGAEVPTQSGPALLLGLMNQRLSEGKAMMISSNLDLKELQKTYSDRFLSRLLGSFKYLEMYGPDLRLRRF